MSEAHREYGAHIRMLTDIRDDAPTHVGEERRTRIFPGRRGKIYVAGPILLVAQVAVALEVVTRRPSKPRSHRREPPAPSQSGSLR